MRKLLNYIFQLVRDIFRLLRWIIKTFVLLPVGIGFFLGVVYLKLALGLLLASLQTPGLFLARFLAQCKIGLSSCKMKHRALSQPLKALFYLVYPSYAFFETVYYTLTETLTDIINIALGSLMILPGLLYVLLTGERQRPSRLVSWIYTSLKTPSFRLKYYASLLRLSANKKEGEFESELASYLREHDYRVTLSSSTLVKLQGRLAKEEMDMDGETGNLLAQVSAKEVLLMCRHYPSERTDTFQEGVRQEEVIRWISKEVRQDAISKINRDYEVRQHHQNMTAPLEESVERVKNQPEMRYCKKAGLTFEFKQYLSFNTPKLSLLVDGKESSIGDTECTERNELFEYPVSQEPSTFQKIKYAYKSTAKAQSYLHLIIIADEIRKAMSKANKSIRCQRGHFSYQEIEKKAQSHIDVLLADPTFKAKWDKLEGAQSMEPLTVLCHLLGRSRYAYLFKTTWCAEQAGVLFQEEEESQLSTLLGEQDAEYRAKKFLKDFFEQKESKMLVSSPSAGQPALLLPRRTQTFGELCQTLGGFYPDLDKQPKYSFKGGIVRVEGKDFAPSSWVPKNHIGAAVPVQINREDTNEQKKSVGRRKEESKQQNRLVM